jgi:magnesium-transporting ATPase (P-type)
METHTNGTKRGKVIFYLLILGFLLIMLFLDNFNTLFPVEGTNIEKTDAYIERSFYFNVVNAIVHIAFTFIVVYMGKLIIKSGKFPPNGMPIPYRIKITYVKNPNYIWLVIGILLLMFLLNIFSGFYEWYAVNELWEGIKKDG